MLSDQSNREGISNERAFSVFRNIIIALIREFEYDRSYILHHLLKAYDIDHPVDKDVEEGNRLADKKLKDREDSSKSGSGKTNAASDEAEKISKALKFEQKKNEELKDEMQVLRGMATLGTVLVSFTHELKQIKANMDIRKSRMENALKDVVDEEKLKLIPEKVNPFNIMERWGREDTKVSRWIDFALTAVSPKKRRRGVINLVNYLTGLSQHWEEFLSSKQVQMHIDCKNEVSLNLLAYEIDLDSIFYNLIVNSIEAFYQPSEAKTREIWVEVSVLLEENKIQIIYKDNGPGISSHFNIAEDIFLYGLSSKGNKSQSEVNGTGIGMWLVNSIVDDYNGKVNLDCTIGEENFSLAIELPLYQKDLNVK